MTRFSIYENSHLSYLFLFVFNHFIVLSFVKFQDLSHYWINIFSELSLTLPYMCVYVYIYVSVYKNIFIQYCGIYHINIFMFYVYMYISALYILFAPGSYTSHWLIFFVVNMTGNNAYLILSYLILSYLILTCLRLISFAQNSNVLTISIVSVFVDCYDISMKHTQRPSTCVSLNIV